MPVKVNEQKESSSARAKEIVQIEVLETQWSKRYCRQCLDCKVDKEEAKVRALANRAEQPAM